jgi:phosphoglycerate dehydrogenase-like enzyme
MNIYVDTPFEQSQKDKLRLKVPDGHFHFKDEIPSSDAQLAALMNAEIILGNPRPVEWLAQAGKAKWVQLYSTGFEYYRGVNIPAVFTNMQDYYAQPCAETVVAGIMALYRGMDVLTDLKNRGRWVGHTMRTDLRMLNGRKVIILGYGHIGKRVSAILKGFNCSISIFARNAPEAVIRTKEELLQEIGKADIVIGCLPGTEETKGLFSREMIGALAPGSLFCNVGRGNLVADEGFLLSRIREGSIGGAVLDVTSLEPIPEGHPLWDCPNLILSQHTGGGSGTEYEGIADFFLFNLERYREGLPLQCRIDINRGY